MYNPVPGSRLSSDYKGGYRSSGGHDGVDFAAPRGSRAHAFFDGTVISTGWGGAYGNLTKVQHTDGTVGYYAHLDKQIAKKGTKVRRGDVIGLVGSTGNSTGPHLHVSVYRDGKMQSPHEWLEGTGSYNEGADGGGQGAPMPDIYTGSTTEQTIYNDPAMVLGNIPPNAGGWDTPGLDGQNTGNPMELGNLLGREAAAGAHAAMAELPTAPAPTSTTTQHFAPGGRGGVPGGGGGGSDLQKLIAAIAQQESGNNYGAVNPSSGASGKYQIMPANIGPWSKEALGYRISRSQFMRNPDLQDQIARHKLTEYHKKYGVAGAAQAWYAGPGSLSYSDSALNRGQAGGHPSISGYVRQVLEKAGIGG